MQKLFSAFPDGWPGLGLILLRLAIAGSGFAWAFVLLSAPGPVSLGAEALALAAILLSLAIAIGLITPVVALIATSAYFVKAVLLLLASGGLRQAPSCSALDMAVMSLVLSLLGPGAYSLDARLFGRREIIIPEGRRSRPIPR